ncbi:metal ABC transporter substrate-binding protein [Thermosynechococcus sp. TG252]|uniref:metal ABC transporter substrate-binding protein n=1 Tax=Thermosynechococcus sp. TG252 TaxID=3074097 RepID=UPI00285FA27D|nr:metal ABC transporter substrate-binding protein [Thermosynechococcus sp. TG252]MDR7993960.1 metal ABC transporter substrate-binding protein [Thermosynechococcus sp. TG252]
MENAMRQLSWLLVGVLVVGGCAALAPEQRETTGQMQTDRDERPLVLTTFTVLADMAQAVAGDRLRVESLIKAGAEVHGYEFTPSDLVRGQEAALILENGLGLERWGDRFYNSLPNVPRVTLTEGITPIPIQEGAYRGAPNPHAWMSPQNALIYVENIRKALTDLDPAGAEIYAANAAAYKAQIRALDQELRQALAALPANKRYIVTCEGAFSYLARDYDLEEVYLWPVNADEEGTPRQMTRVIDIVRRQQIPAVFCESTVNAGPQQQVARESGATLGGIFYVDSLSSPEGNAPTYLELLRYNIHTLIRGLTGRTAS